MPNVIDLDRCCEAICTKKMFSRRKSSNSRKASMSRELMLSCLSAVKKSVCRSLCATLAGDSAAYCANRIDKVCRVHFATIMLLKSFHFGFSLSLSLLEL